MTQSDMVTYATAFGQIKITGNLSPDLQERAINAIKRLSLVWENELTEIQTKMIDDLLSFTMQKTDYTKQTSSMTRICTLSSKVISI